MKSLSHQREDNFYESFSDLMFCTVVLFVLLVLLLAMSVEKRVSESLDRSSGTPVDLRPYKETIAQSKAQTERLSDTLRDALLDKSELDSQLKHALKQISAISETKRLTGTSGIATMAVVHSLKSKPYVCWPIPAQLYSDFTTPFLGETADEAKARTRRVREKVREIVRTVPPLRGEDYIAIQHAVSRYYCQADADRMQVGVVLGAVDGAVKLTGTVPLSTAESASLRRGDTLLRVGGADLRGLSVAETVSSIENELADLKVGDELTIEFESDGAVKSRTVPLVATAFEVNSAYRRLIANLNGVATGIVDLDGTVLNAQLGKLIDPTAGDAGEVAAAFSKRLKDIKAALELELTDEELSRQRNRWAMIASGVPVGREPTLRYKVLSGQRKIQVADVILSADQFVMLLRSVSGRNLIIESEHNLEDQPQWFVDSVLVPTGFVNVSAPEAVAETRIK